MKLFEKSRIAGLVEGLKDGTAFQLKLRDRVSAGRVLASVLKRPVRSMLNKDSRFGRPILAVFGIPRGGVIVADIIAETLNADYFDLVISRKLRAPDNKENSVGAIAPDGSMFLDEFTAGSLKVPREYIEKEKEEQLGEIARRNSAFLRGISKDRDKGITQPGRSGRALIALLIDDGIATGTTALVSARWLKAKYAPQELIIGTPIASTQSVGLLRREGFQVESILTPTSFVSVNQFYKDFDQDTDLKVAEILARRMSGQC